MEPYPECMEMAEKYDRTILRSQDTTSALMSTIIAALKIYLSPRITRHGVLVDVYAVVCCCWASRAWARARPPLSWSSGATA